MSPELTETLAAGLTALGLSPAPAALDPAWAERYGEEILTRQLEAMVAPYGVVSSTLCTSRQQGDALAVTLTAECREEIGRTVEREGTVGRIPGTPGTGNG